MNNCQAKHENHDRKIVSTIIGDMNIYEWEKYMDFKGYCTGQDSVSQTIESTRSWDIAVFQRMKSILEAGDRKGTFLDIGCHIGWFSKIAELMGYAVNSYDGDAENLELLKINAPTAKGIFMWFDETIKPKKACGSCSIQKKIELVKIDIEGNEQYAIKYLENYLKKGLISHLIIEITPVFNGSYPALVEQLESYGYQAFELNGVPFNHDFNFHQKDLWFRL